MSLLVAEPALGMDLLRFSTAGSVDDGKSTLIGRLLYETKNVFQDQLEELEALQRRHGSAYLDLALLTDGLRAEREQGITIDVAYRYFSTAHRKFIVADTPGHAQYTRNMVTGTSTADLSIILLDASRGITEQSRRHAFIAALLRVPHVVACVNKMDLAEYDQAAFVNIQDAFVQFCEDLGISDLRCIPISALHGDNVVEHSPRMPWYDGPALLEYLETATPGLQRNLVAGRFPVQWVTRPRPGDAVLHRGYAGQVAGGVLRPGDEVIVLPAGASTRIRTIETFDGPLAEAFPPMSVTITLEDDIDISRGDLIAQASNPPIVGQDLNATLCWLNPTPLNTRLKYAIKHNTALKRVVVRDVHHVVDVNTLEADETATHLRLNEIGRVTLRAASPLFYDRYAENRTTGSFILIDEGSNETVAAGLIDGPA